MPGHRECLNASRSLTLSVKRDEFKPGSHTTRLIILAFQLCFEIFPAVSDFLAGNETRTGGFGPRFVNQVTANPSSFLRGKAECL